MSILDVESFNHANRGIVLALGVAHDGDLLRRHGWGCFQGVDTVFLYFKNVSVLGSESEQITARGLRGQAYDLESFGVPKW